jgi:hypothetical protein
MGCSAGLAALAFVPVGIALCLVNVVFPSSALPGTLVWAYLASALMMAGAKAQRASAKLGAHVIAGMAAGLVIASLGLATYLVIDNALLSVVGAQQDNIEGLRQSGMASMRAYLNGNLETVAPFLALGLAVAGAVFAPIGAAIARRLRSDTTPRMM